MIRNVREYGGRYVRDRVSRGLDGVHARGLERLSGGPLLVVANHVSWWDGLVMVVLTERAGMDLRFVMSAEQLDRYPFFEAFGAIGIDRSSPAAVLPAMRQAVRWLDQPGRALWFFPQGEQRPAHLRPLGLQRGVELIARRTGATVAPVALDYVWREAPQPAAYAAFEPPVEPTLAAMEAALRTGLDRIWTAPDQFDLVAEPTREADAASAALAAMWRALA